jgi:hypothetical protein
MLTDTQPWHKGNATAGKTVFGELMPCHSAERALVCD